MDKKFSIHVGTLEYGVFDDVLISYDLRDVLLYAVGIGIRDLCFIYEGHPQLCVLPTFPGMATKN